VNFGSGRLVLFFGIVAVICEPLTPNICSQIVSVIFETVGMLDKAGLILQPSNGSFDILLFSIHSHQKQLSLRPYVI